MIAMGDDMSTIYCGCDKEAGYMCTRHKMVATGLQAAESLLLTDFKDTWSEKLTSDDEEADVNDYKGVQTVVDTSAVPSATYAGIAVPNDYGGVHYGFVTFKEGTGLPDEPAPLSPERRYEYYPGVNVFTSHGTTTTVPYLGIGGAPTRATTLPTEGAARKQFPVASGVLDYFPDALVAVANVSWAGNEQHNPGQPLHWARGKSTDESDTMIRHFLQRGSLDTDGQRHSAKMVWRALAILQKEIEGENK